MQLPAPVWIAWLVLPGLLALSGCGGSGLGSPPAGPAGAFASLGELEDAIEAAVTSATAAERRDSDGDSLPDSVEARLGTDPHGADSDRDGLIDRIELFTDGYRRGDPLPDLDRDGAIAPLDNDDDGDRINDGIRVDTDSDGVPNYLELYGYSFDVLTGRFVQWNGDPSTPHFFTDPLQPSTDQDAYSDGVEASGAMQDPTVRQPGDDPLVPAYPNLVCELVSYSVTLNEDIQITESESFSKGQSWSRQTEQSHSFGVQTSWELGSEYDFSATGGFKVSAKLGQTYESTNSTTTSVGIGGSITSDAGWSAARSMNPTRAAHLKLYLRVHNRGTAPVSNLVPTLSLKIGGLNVATFEPAGANVNLLVPGATYPTEPGWLWVVDARNTGGGTEPLSLTMSELRALERGAPVSLSVAQIQGDAMRLAQDGTWTSVGDTNEFTARCDAVCANLRIELEDGTQVHHLVYADDAPSAPPMTLGQALGKIGVDEGITLHYTDEAGTPRSQSLDGFNTAIDSPTLRANGWTLAADDPTGVAETAAPTGFALATMRLLPDSVIYLRAPRPLDAPLEPTVHFATLDPDTGEIQVSVADYQGIASAVVHNQYDPAEDDYRQQALTESVPGAGFFGGSARGPGGFDPSDLLSVDVLSLSGHGQTRELGSLFVVPGPQKPVIHLASLDLDSLRIYANVESGNPENPNSNIQWIRAYHPDFAGGFVEMQRVYDFYRDPLGYEATLPPNFGEDRRDVEVVAYVLQSVQEVAFLSLADAEPVDVLHNQTRTLIPAADGNYDWLGNLTSVQWEITRLTLDAEPGTSVVSTRTTTTGTRAIPIQPPAKPGAPIDLVLQFDAPNALAWARFYFNAEYKKLTVGGLTRYRELSRDDILALDAEISSRSTLKVGSGGGDDLLRPGDVLAIRTTAGFPAKLYLERVVYDHNVLQGRWWAKVTIRYVTFDKVAPP